MIKRLFTTLSSFLSSLNYWLFVSGISAIVLILGGFGIIAISDLDGYFLLLISFLSLGIYDILKGQQPKSDV